MKNSLNRQINNRRRTEERRRRRAPPLSAVCRQRNSGSARRLRGKRFPLLLFLLLSASEMFATATRNFVEEVDKGGVLIPVSCLNDNIRLLTVVVKRKRFWFWQKPKYDPADFLLGDLLTGDSPLKPVVMEKDFLKYSGTFGDSVQGTVGGTVVKANASVEGKDTTKLQSTFGPLKKEEVDVQKLLLDCKDRVLDMSHSLIQQTKEKHKQVFGIVKERIVTTQPCSVIEEVQQGGQCGGALTSCLTSSKVSLKENGSFNKDSNVTVEIPISSIVAYGLIELEVRKDGRFELCLMSDTNGGFEDVDGPLRRTELLGVSGAPAAKQQLQQQLEHLKDHFQLLSALPASTRASLLQQVSELLQDAAAIGDLQEVLDRMHVGGAGRTESPRQEVQEILNLLERSGETESTQRRSFLTALHLVISALDEITRDCLAALRRCTSPAALQTLELLAQSASGGGGTPLSSADLTEDLFETTRHLFASSNVSLQRDGDVVRTEIIGPQPDLPLVLCIAIRGLASLAHS
ncbi:gasdermin Eb [Kryptolebias marmoratus]|nr:gasdermin Eb [Kryptolebias marmoratus]